ncbi:DUF1326 domain-containing protein [Microvirga makkahensis]|uniref:DUF1326 domain-containing protein n=1 Tax=Microvirga makkahensis TaxID=1128670 RepID=A0A7X3MUU8_9HYPH|nr:DUF1326 domain-containing protein [Microvirga makkahensis]MXQ13530.1 DUF1326 domain-containing protein [Microvirga makkahensis]
MPDVTWTIKGREFIHCNCDYGCPCQFNARPSHGHCHAVAGIEIAEGYHGNTKLDGLKVACVLAWPGAIHEGRGHATPIVDGRATPEQREALLRIMSGEDTEPGATFFQVFASTYEKVNDPIFARIDLEIDVDGRTARLRVPGVIDARGEPILNPVTGQPHQARINLPNGFEYTVAEIGRGWGTATGAIELNLEDSHAHFAHLHMTGSGVVRPTP